MSNEKIKHVTDASFEADVLKANGLVLVDYSADWCGPCKMIAPVLDEIADSYDGRVLIAKIDVDANREVAEKQRIRGVPTLMLFRDGKVADTKVGALSKSQLSAFIDANL
ncbi:thioredoxin TrxA [Pseudomonas fluorescens]|jgi:thioredoxin 1|uniref:thioredoxin TrxA n=1 Tax=Pseudomonas fluorescens TaxID=294 RepID=UPI000CA2CDFF|nr:thioredoxin TrxA [Pseudomonas fluorescens]AUM70537.1 thiol reductase thioredoxin [Pseudomonas fluorescens]